MQTNYIYIASCNVDVMNHLSQLPYFNRLFRARSLCQNRDERLNIQRAICIYHSNAIFFPLLLYKAIPTPPFS